MTRTIKRLLVPAVAICAFLLLSECQKVDSGGVTVSGTLTSSMNLDLSTGTVTVTSGGNNYTTQVSIPAPEPQTMTYSISDVPTGTYDVAIALDSGIDWDVSSYDFTLSVDGVPQTATDDRARPVRTFAVSGLSIAGSATIDLTISPAR